jgi:hypothetical protein
MRHRYYTPFTTSVALTVLVCTAGCRTTNGLEPCPTAVAVEVSSGLTPTFRWKPACSLGSVYVERIDASGRSMLWLAFDPENKIRPGVAYGTGQSAPILEPGGTYRVTVGTVVGGDAASIQGSRDFRR